MNKRLKARWVKALRSGKYTQGKSQLRERLSDGTMKYCCLGVLACLVDPEATTWRDKEGVFGSNDTRIPETISPRRAEAQIHLIGGPIHPEIFNKLANFNDGNGFAGIERRSFKAIASWIEKSKAL